MAFEPDPHDIELSLNAVARWVAEGDVCLLPLFIRLEHEASKLEERKHAAARARVHAYKFQRMAC